MVSETRRQAARSPVRAAVLFAALTWCLPAAADPTPADRESARALMDEGDARYDAHNYEAALQAYGAANTIMRVPTTGYAFAKTLAALGRLVEARDAAMLVTHMPAKPNENRPFVQARAAAEALSNQLQAAIASLAISVDGASADELRVDVDGIPVPAALLNLPRQTDPGAHVVRATAAGYIDDRRELTLAKGESATLTLTLRKLAAPEPQVASAAVTPTGEGIEPLFSPVQRTPRAPAPSADGSSPGRTTGLVLAGAGAALVGVGGVLALGARSKYHSVDCDPDGVCDRDAYDARSDARSRGVFASVVMVVGAAAFASGVVVYLMAPSASTRVGVSAQGALLRGTF